jgi:hypothetical protein
MFSARNPYFINKGGKISVIAHSLGCVILYDIIMGLKPGSLVPNTQQGLLFQVIILLLKIFYEMLVFVTKFNFFSDSKFLLSGIAFVCVFGVKMERFSNPRKNGYHSASTLMSSIV